MKNNVEIDVPPGFGGGVMKLIVRDVDGQRAFVIDDASEEAKTIQQIQAYLPEYSFDDVFRHLITLCLLHDGSLKTEEQIVRNAVRQARIFQQKLRDSAYHASEWTGGAV